VTERPQDVVRAGYDRIGERYQRASHPNPVRLERLRELFDRLAPRSTVVDLGCGAGDPATRLLTEASHRVLGVDISREQLRLAQRLAPGAAYAQADLVDLALRQESVDAVVSFYALGHLPSAAHRPLLARVGGWLRPGGFLLISAPLGAGDDSDPDWLGVPMFFGGIGVDATLAAVTDGGLTVQDAKVVGEDEGGGKVVEFLWVTARKPMRS
jgi:cyclopropane fatty-acyl-phospholipid synthase-like methyltransferase